MQLNIFLSIISFGMIISCQNNNDMNNFDSLLIPLIDTPQPSDIITIFYETHVTVKEESISISDLFKTLNLPLKVKYIFHYNPSIFINFSGSIKDLLTYLHSVTNVHSNIQTEKDIMIITFDECKIHKRYNLAGVNQNSFDIISAIKPYTFNASKITNNIISVEASCDNHKKILEIININNYLNNIYMEIEVATIDIHFSSSSDNDCIPFIKNILNLANQTGNLNISQITNDISDWMQNNAKGHAEITSNTIFTLFNNSSIEIHTGIDDTSRINSRKSHTVIHDKNKSYVKMNVSAYCTNTEYANLNFVIQNKCEIDNKRACVNNFTTNIKIPNNTIYYLLNIEENKIVKHKHLFFNEEKSVKKQTIFIVKSNIKEGANREN